MRINHNIAALNTHRQLNAASTNQSKSMEKLASGLRINKAGDDAAGLAISEKMRGQIRGLDQASKNAQDGISMIQTAEGALNETHDILQRMRELATQAANDTNTDTDRGEIQKEINQLTSEINRIGNTTEFNTKKLLKGGPEATGQVGSVTNTAGIAAGGTDATAELVAKGLTISGAGDGTDYNGYAVTIADNTTEGIAVDYDAKTITISLDLQNTPSNDISGFTPTTTGTAPAGGAFTFSGDASSLTATDVGSLGTTAGGSAASLGTAGSTDFTITKALAAGDTIDVAGETITVYKDDAELAAANNGTGDTFGISLESDATAADQADAIRSMTFADRTVTGTGAQIVITQDTAGTGDVSGPVLGTVNGGADFGASFQIGANAGQSMTIDVRDMRATSDALAIASKDGSTVQSNSGKTAYYTDATAVTNGTDNQGQFKSLDVSSHDKASAAIDVINDAIEEVSAERSKLGANQNRLEHTINNLNTSSENLTAAESRIRDVDYALAA